MRPMNVILIIVGAVVVVGIGIGWFFCGGGMNALSRAYEDDATSPAVIDEVRVAGGTVRVRLRPWDGQGFRIHRTARYFNWLHDHPAATHRVEGSVLVLGGDPTTNLAIVEYVVDAPAGVRVTADVGTGDLDVADVSSVDARIGTGSVLVTGARGDVEAKVGTGSVSVDLAVPADVDARSDMGAVSVTAPRDAYRIEAASKMGAVNLGLPSDPAAPHRLSLFTKMGAVTVAAR